MILKCIFIEPKNGAEIDLVLVKGINPVACIEIKYSNTPTTEARRKRMYSGLKNQKKFCDNPGQSNGVNKKKNTVVSLFNFLKTELPTF